MPLERLYAIVDIDLLAKKNLALLPFAEALRRGGARLVQYRNKSGTPQQILDDAATLSEVFVNSGTTLVMNDRADLAPLVGWNAVHVGQDDLPPAAVRRVLRPDAIVGLSTHTEAEVIAADQATDPPSYLAIGPVFPTGTKADAAAVVGLEGVRRARALTQLPLVAIGGITLANAASVLEAGADSVAVISGLFPATDHSKHAPATTLENAIQITVEDFLTRLR